VAVHLLRGGGGGGRGAAVLKTNMVPGQPGHGAETRLCSCQVTGRGANPASPPPPLPATRSPVAAAPVDWPNKHALLLTMRKMKTTPSPQRRRPCFPTACAAMPTLPRLLPTSRLWPPPPIWPPLLRPTLAPCTPAAAPHPPTRLLLLLQAAATHPCAALLL
jgi:hypothetical protein